MTFYKETDFQVTSMGRIPRDWEVAELGDSSIVEIILGQSPPSSTYNTQDKGLPFLQGKMEFGYIYPKPTSFCSEPAKIAEPNDILLSVRAPVGAVNIAQKRYCIGRGLSAIRAKREKLSHLFLFYYLCYAEKRFSSISMGSTFKAIRKDEIEKFSITLPRLQEQKVIAEVLSCVDLAVQKTDEVIAKTQRLKKGLMQQLLTKGIGHREFEEYPKLGNLPEEWEIEKIGNFCSVVTGGTPSTKHPEYFNGDIKWLKSGDIKGLYIYDTEQKITQLGLENSNAKIHPENSVVIALSGRGQTRGRTAVTKMPMACSQSVAFMIPNEEIVPEYLHYNLSNRYMEIRYLTGDLDRSGLNLSMVSNIKVPIPKLGEQRQIVSILASIDEKLELERKEKTKLERIKLELMDLLLTGKIRVRLD